ncbi:MAG: hypothetical protein OXH83_00245 [Bryobacterales bacterium]|nr:hypothetical protein [Bryobacterales bacterium]
MSLKDAVSQCWLTFQQALFPWLVEELGPLSERHKRLVPVLEFVRVGELLPGTRGSGASRPQESRADLARAFLAKAVFAVPTTRAAGRAAAQRPNAALAVRLGDCPRGAQRGDLLAGLCGLCNERVGRALARGFGRADAAGSLGGARLARLDGDPGARAAGA